MMNIMMMQHKKKEKKLVMLFKESSWALPIEERRQISRVVLVVLEKK